MSRGTLVGRIFDPCSVGNLLIPLQFSHEPHGFESRWERHQDVGSLWGQFGTKRHFAAVEEYSTELMACIGADAKAHAPTREALDRRPAESLFGSY